MAQENTMQKEYRQLYRLLDQPEPWLPRLKQILEIVQQSDFQYQKENGADLILNMFVRSSYWLDKELFDDSYLYKKGKQNLLPMQEIHFQMVKIGTVLLEKGFPLRYNASEYSELGPNQLGPYVKVFVEQCQKKQNLLHKKITHKNQAPAHEKFSRVIC